MFIGRPPKWRCSLELSAPRVQVAVARSRRTPGSNRRGGLWVPLWGVIFFGYEDNFGWLTYPGYSPLRLRTQEMGSNIFETDLRWSLRLVGSKPAPLETCSRWARCAAPDASKDSGTGGLRVTPRHEGSPRDVCLQGPRKPSFCMICGELA